MKAKKYKHLSFEDRCVIEEFLNHNFNFTQIANRLHKNRTTISKEVLKHRFLRGQASPSRSCCFESRPPYVCNSCDKLSHCKKQKYSYSAHIAYNEYKQTLISERSHLHISKQQIASINEVISPLMIYQNHSVNQVYISHPELLPFSKTTFYKYIDLGLLNVRNIDLQRKVFRQFNFMLIYLMPYKKSVFVTEIFNNLKEVLGIVEFKRLFEVILTDNGSEFMDPESIEIDINTGEKVSSLFYCDPNCSWQKGSIEKNHEFIRYILPKGTSFASLSQDDCYLIASHINSTPRVSLNNHSPYEASLLFIGKQNMEKLQIKKIDYDDINLSYRLLKK